MIGIEGTIIARKLVQVDTYERDQYIYVEDCLGSHHWYIAASDWHLLIAAGHACL